MIKKPSYEEIVVPDEYTGKRVDTAISDLVPNITRARIKRLIEQQRILIDAQPVKPSKKLVGGEVVRIEYEEPQELEITAEDIDIDIVYEDIDIAVINKPAGMSVHPGAGIKSGTLVNALLYKCKDLSGIGGKIRPGIVHRLDKDTSGIMVVAKNDMSHNRLAEQFKSREVEKKYFALLSGTMKAKSGTISLPLGRHRTKRIKFSSDSSSAKSAVTKWKLIENYKSSCLVEAMPHTGRTHQIRVHFAEVGHPILGDRLYG
ncbi:MAG: RluA family pseudouridine synthase, partial [Candidatus Dadabacteria bacterium]|nr:RluA family pseudouridine synthase [Candidatus Dadabacteria bacterium]